MKKLVLLAFLVFPGTVLGGYTNLATEPIRSAGLTPSAGDLIRGCTAILDIAAGKPVTHAQSADFWTGYMHGYFHSIQPAKFKDWCIPDGGVTREHLADAVLRRALTWGETEGLSARVLFFMAITDEFPCDAVD